ncbi:hypothetical protein HHL28_15230 [Aerophototrophica crusticola]|uniref:Cobalt transporter n=1 Tax=Aerophototrophica crusticola TaxID=1709002 RepID=A0A858RAU8_9PROT|nr:hypothetical protein HHL28_15230 [Rhodospirillaceae bacterium B3]
MVNRLLSRVLSLLVALALLAGTAVPAVAAGPVGGQHHAAIATHGHGNGHASAGHDHHQDMAVMDAALGCPHSPDDADHPGMAADCLKACLGITLLSQVDPLRLPPRWPADFFPPLSDGLSGLKPEPALEPPRPALAA